MMEKSDTTGKIATAFAAFLGEVENPPLNANNPFFKSNYADLPNILKLIRPILSKHGLAVHQEVNAEGIYTLLMHNSGEWILAGPLPLLVEKSSMQSEGSAITYGRRYAICAALCIAGEEDDDANTAEPSKEAPTTTNSIPYTPPKAVTKALEGAASDKQIGLIHVLVDKLNFGKEEFQPYRDRYGITSTKELTKKQASDMIKELQGILDLKEEAERELEGSIDESPF